MKRTVYSLTPKGEQALHEWLTDSENVIFEIRDEGLLRLFFGDLLSRDEVLANLRTQEQLFEHGAGSASGRSRSTRGTAFAERAASTPISRCGTGSTSSPVRRDWYAERARRLEAGEPLVELEDGEAAGGKAGLGAAG